jgi:hypothetical protein
MLLLGPRKKWLFEVIVDPTKLIALMEIWASLPISGYNYQINA